MRNTTLTGLYEKADPVFTSYSIRCCDYQIQYLKIGNIHFLTCQNFVPSRIIQKVDYSTFEAFISKR